MKRIKLKALLKEESKKSNESLAGSQGYAQDYYNLKSDITETWESIEDVKSDMMNYFKALNDVQGSSQSVVTTGVKGLGGSRLVQAVADEIIKIAQAAKAKYQ